VQHVIIFLVTS